MYLQNYTADLGEFISKFSINVDKGTRSQLFFLNEIIC
jgi:hypothetical protein